MKSHHAFLAGFVCGLVLSTETLVVLVVGFALGGGAVLLWSAAVGLVSWARGLLERRSSGGATLEEPTGSDVDDWWRE